MILSAICGFSVSSTIFFISNELISHRSWWISVVLNAHFHISSINQTLKTPINSMWTLSVSLIISKSIVISLKLFIREKNSETIIKIFEYFVYFVKHKTTSAKCIWKGLVYLCQSKWNVKQRILVCATCFSEKKSEHWHDFEWNQIKNRQIMWHKAKTVPFYVHNVVIWMF